MLICFGLFTENGSSRNVLREHDGMPPCSRPSKNALINSSEIICDEVANIELKFTISDSTGLTQITNQKFLLPIKYLKNNR